MLKRIILFTLIIFNLPLHAAQEPPPSEEVFQFMAAVRDPNTINLTWQIKPGFFLYRERIHFKVVHQDAISLGRMSLPAGKQKFDQAIGQYQIYRDKLDLALPVKGEKQGVSDIIVHYQGCSDSGFCYPPVSKKLQITFNASDAASSVKVLSYEKRKTKSMDPMQQLFNKHRFPFILLSFFGFGLLLALTPCVLPMVPVLSGIIVGHGEKMTTRKAFILSSIYVFSMSLAYAAVGLIIAVFGSNVQAAMQSTPVIISFALVFVLLALSMFGFYDLKLPVSIQHWFAELSHKQRGGTYFGAAIMGALSTLILSPCVTPPLVGTLGFIAQSGNVLLGTTALFCLGLGMGAPLILVGTSGGKFLPKAGVWMNAVKNVFGVMLLAVAIFLLDRVLTRQSIMFLSSILLVVSAMYMGALKRMPTSHWGKLWQGLGILMLVYGILLLVGACMGNSNLLSPLEKTAPQTIHHGLQYKKVKSLQDVKKALRQAEGKYVILDFYADWCLGCKIMERTTFTDPRVLSALNDIVILKADVTANDAIDKQLQNHFKVIAPPTFIFFDKAGQQTKFRLVGEVGAKDFLTYLRQFTLEQQ